jgi:hypothetical protein
MRFFVPDSALGSRIVMTPSLYEASTLAGFTADGRRTVRTKSALLQLPPEVLLVLLFLLEVPPPGDREDLSLDIDVEIVLRDARRLDPHDVFLLVLGEIQIGHPDRLEDARGLTGERPRPNKRSNRFSKSSRMSVVVGAALVSFMVSSGIP